MFEVQLDEIDKLEKFRCKFDFSQEDCINLCVTVLLWEADVFDHGATGGRMDLEYGSGGSVSAAAIDSSNIGFQLLKKHGWREGTGLGVSEQGRLEPVQASIKNNKRGLGADKVKKKLKETTDIAASDRKNNQKAKGLSKRMRKMQEEERLFQEKEFERAFFREFWPENV
ncbi:protein PXR1 [Benincasa hispida]|uniref:protein PXR1 n=1 Tax=Benincasa hispida TaxID=102211 RepID=UPI0018FFF69C|nr:protein PXR1 [Benincasa hispida]